MRRPLILLLFVLLSGLGVAACGGGDDVDVDQTLKETFGENKDVKSGRLDLNLRLDARGLASLSGPVAIRLAGPFEANGDEELPRFSLEANLDAGGQSIRAGATSTGEKGFLSFQGQPYVLSDELFKQFKDGYAEEARKNKDDGGDGVSFKSLGIDPQRWLRDPKYEGKEDVGGAETLHIKAGIDVPRLLEDVNRILGRAPQIEGQPQARQLSEEERGQISEAIKDAKLDLWTGEDDKILRRLAVELDFEVPEANRQQAQGLTSGTLRFQIGLGAINQEQDIKEPENAKPFQELIAAVGGGQAAPPAQSGGAGGAGGGSGGSGGTGGESAGTPYEKCVQEAGTDSAKLQECASLAGG